MKEEYQDDYNGFFKPEFSLYNRFLRLLWIVVWKLFCSWTPRPFHSWRCFVIRCFGGTIGNNNFIYPTCKIWAPWLLITEDVVTIGPDVELYNPAGAYLQDHCIISQGAYICGATHDYNTINFTFIKKKIIIESYSWICARAMVLPGVTCKKGSVLGAGSITSKDLDAWCVYAGVPAIKVKERNIII